MISAIEVYLVMQLDKVESMITLFTALSALGYIGTCIAEYEGYIDSITSKLSRKIFGRILIVLSVSVALIPSSQTAAAMIILPKIVSNENMSALSKEAREIYSMAKEALRKTDKSSGEK